MTPGSMIFISLVLLSLGYWFGWIMGRFQRTSTSQVVELQEELSKVYGLLEVSKNTIALLRKELEVETMIREKKAEATRKPEDLKAKK